MVVWVAFADSAEDRLIAGYGKWEKGKLKSSALVQNEDIFSWKFANTANKKQEVAIK